MTSVPDQAAAGSAFSGELELRKAVEDIDALLQNEDGKAEEFFAYIGGLRRYLHMSVLDIARFQRIVRQYTMNRIESGDVVVSRVEKKRGVHLVHNYELLQKMVEEEFGADDLGSRKSYDIVHNGCLYALLLEQYLMPVDMQVVDDIWRDSYPW